jgi:predicted  nucleic acid-binding Zn-ribbon protein
MEEQNQVEGTSDEIRDPKAVLEALDKAKAEAKKFRLEKEALEQQINETSAKASQVQSRLMMEKINKHLSSLGIQHGEKLNKYLKMDSLSLTDDFEVAGLDEQIADLKTDFPELFDPKFIVAGKADTGVTTSVEIPKTATDLQVKQILNK